MLVLSRKEGESIEFRDLDVCVRVIQLKKSKVQLGIEAPRTIQVDRTETLGRYADKEYCGGHQMLSPLDQKFAQKRVQADHGEPEERLVNELAKLEVEVMTLAELVTSNDKKLAGQTALIALERLHRLRKMLRASSAVRSTCSTISDFIHTRNHQATGADSGGGSADAMVSQAHQGLASKRTSESSTGCLRQSGVGYVLEADVTGFSEQRVV